VATLGAVGAAFGELTSHAVQREKERDLLFVGNEYRKAIAGYYRGTPGAIKRYPQSLEDLLEDRRYPTPVRHSRRAQPVAGTTNQIRGIRLPRPGAGRRAHVRGMALRL